MGILAILVFALTHSVLQLLWCSRSLCLPFCLILRNMHVMQCSGVRTYKSLVALPRLLRYNGTTLSSVPIVVPNKPISISLP